MSPKTRCSGSRKVLLALAVVSLVVIGTSASSIPSVSSPLSKHKKQAQKQTTFQQRIQAEADSSPVASLTSCSAATTASLTDVRCGAAAPSKLAVTPSASTVALLQNLKVGFYFALWYALNIYYNSKFQMIKKIVEGSPSIRVCVSGMIQSSNSPCTFIT
jgi:hypothetical protein